VLNVIRDEVMVVLTVDTLEYAWKSGRVGAIKAALSSILDIKPIIVLQDGVMEMTEMVRTRKKSLERVVLKIKGHFGDHPVRLAIVHAQDNETAKKIEGMVLDVLSVVEIVFTELSISVAANLGPGTVGIVALPAEL
jgi:DegV family protein with EDD domain